MALVYTGIVAYWIWLLLQKDNRVLRIHWLMAGLAVLKIASLIFHAIDYHQLARNGHPGAWAVVYYIFAFLKGVMLFIVILLIGTGWSLIKPYLSEEDKKIFMIVLPLQVLDNIALIVVEEMAPGSQGWFTWKDIFRLVDIICCGAILIPIIWSIRHLREAAVSDGKAARSIEKLQQFRRFYLLVIAYIYFTRIIVILLDAVVPFRQTWLGEFSSELATLAFYCITGYMFRPATNNPYLRLEEEEESRTVALQELTSGQDL
jgi:NADH:ubiquinone oxidoreductase subunit 3 (subunit A)